MVSEGHVGTADLVCKQTIALASCASEHRVSLASNARCRKKCTKSW